MRVDALKKIAEAEQEKKLNLNDKLKEAKKKNDLLFKEIEYGNHLYISLRHLLFMYSFISGAKINTGLYINEISQLIDE